LFYKLHDYCELVQGAYRGAIYDFESGKVYSINNDAVRLLLMCLDHPLEEITHKDLPETKPVLDFFKKLTDMGLGAFYDGETPEKTDPDFCEEEEQLEFLWLELTSRCNNRCLHCYSSSDSHRNDDSVPHARWLSIISEARKAGASSIQLIGGEPLLYQGWEELVIKAKEEGYTFIEVFTNAILIDDACIRFFKEQNVNVATTIYAGTGTIHDTVTCHPGSFERTLGAVKKLLEAGIPVRVASIIMKANEEEAENINMLLTGLGLTPDPPDVVRPTGRGDDKELLPEKYERAYVKPPFYTDLYSFDRAKKYHSCLAGKIAVTSVGDVIPCIFARSEVCGNILTSPLSELLESEILQKYWKTTKDQVVKCRDCEYRYACHDCRPAAQGSDEEKDWFAAPKDCLYDPYTGVWAEE
jgi:radical SAM protein with 4Fe4S-binding SPASM domain